jgi:hypothetical protein
MMTSTIVTVALALAMGSTGGHRDRPLRILPPGPGYGWGFPNGNPDGFGWYNIGDYLPLGADRTPEYYFPRYFSVPMSQLFMPTYENPYYTRGQRYLPYSNCGGAHPAGGPAMVSAATPVHPYNDTIGSGPRVNVPGFSGRVEAPPINSGGTGLTP